MLIQRLLLVYIVTKVVTRNLTTSDVTSDEGSAANASEVH